MGSPALDRHRRARLAPRSAVTEDLTASEALRLRELATRWLVAHLLLNNARGRRVTLEEIGEEMAREEGRASAYDQSTVHRLETGKTEPDGRQILSFCAVLRRGGVTVDPGWLHYGAASSAPAPETPLVDTAHLLRP